MGSVITAWRARTANRSTREELTRYMLALGSHHQLRRAQAAGHEVPAVSKLLSAQRSDGLAEIPDQRQFENQRVEGRVLVNLLLFGDEASGNVDAAACSKPTPSCAPIAERQTARADAVARGLRIETAEQWTFVVLNKAALYGTDFRIFDPRDLYPGEDRMSFVFVDGTGWPLVDGMMVQVDDASVCRSANLEAIKTADLHLTVPHMHLRYFLEEWTDRLFAWMRRYFIADLRYSHYDWNPGFERHDARMAAMESKSSAEAAREQWFENLLAECDTELGQWIGDLSEMARDESSRSISDS